MELFKITCVTCRARLSVRDASLIGQILACPRCGMMVHVTAPAGFQSPEKTAPSTPASHEARQPTTPQREPAEEPVTAQETSIASSSTALEASESTIAQCRSGLSEAAAAGAAGTHPNHTSFDDARRRCGRQGG